MSGKVQQENYALTKVVGRSVVTIGRLWRQSRNSWRWEVGRRGRGFKIGKATTRHMAAVQARAAYGEL